MIGMQLSQVEQLAYIQRDGGSNPPIPSCEMEQMEARQVHTLEVTGSSPVLAMS